MKFFPLNDHYLVRVLPKSLPQSGILLPETYNDHDFRAEIVQVPVDGFEIIEAGATVLVKNDGQNRSVTLGMERLMLVPFENMLGVYENVTQA